MRLFEVTQTLQTMPHLYLDMDGVQCDFMGKWEMLLKTPKYKNSTSLNDAITLLSQSSDREVYEFFRDLMPLNGGSKIVSYLKTYKIPYTILSAPLRGPYSKDSIKGKKEWLDKYNPDTSDSAIFTSGKFKYATSGGQPNVLVDDLSKNINEWRQKGGIGIQHSNNNTDETIKQLDKIYRPFRDK